MSDDIDDQTVIEVQVDEVELPFILARHWLLLFPIDARAKLLYELLVMHVNVARGDRIVKATKDDLAKMMGFQKPDSIDKYLKLLYASDLVEVEKTRTSDGLRDRNKYTVRLRPPAGYEGCLTLGDWYRQKREAAGQLVPPQSGVRGNPTKGKRAGRPVPPATGVRTPPERGPVPPQSGVELDAFEQDEVKPLKRETRASKPPVSSGPKPHPLPEDFVLSDAMRRFAAATFPSLDVDYETAQFRDHYLADGAQRVNWATEWQKWMRRSAKYQSERATRTPKNRAERAQEATNAMFDRAYQGAVHRDALRASGVPFDPFEVFA